MNNINTPIIDPIWFYWMNVSNDFKGWMIFFAVIFTFASIILVASYIDSKSKELKLPSIILVLLSFICITGSTLIPDSNTIKEMMIASQVTPKNIQVMQGVIKDSSNFAKDLVIEIMDHANSSGIAKKEEDK